MNNENKVVDPFGKILARILIGCGIGCLSLSMIALTVRFVFWLFKL